MSFIYLVLFLVVFIGVRVKFTGKDKEGVFNFKRFKVGIRILIVLVKEVLGGGFRSKFKAFSGERIIVED